MILINTESQMTVTPQDLAKDKQNIPCNLWQIPEYISEDIQVCHILNTVTTVLCKSPIAIVLIALKYPIVVMDALTQ